MSPILSSLGTWLNTGLGFVYPDICQVCERHPATKAEGYVCESCWENVRFIKPPFCEHCGLPYEGNITTTFECTNCKDLSFAFRTARAAVTYNEFMTQVIHRYKYQKALWFEPFLADLLIRAARPVLATEPCDLLVPVPLHPAREREREFNQAHRLALKLGKALKIPVNRHLLQRTVHTATQTHLGRKERAENVKKAFALRPNIRLNGERIVLLDDVFTTGATTSACAKLLKSAGAGDISVWTVARGL